MEEANVILGGAWIKERRVKSGPWQGMIVAIWNRDVFFLRAVTDRYLSNWKCNLFPESGKHA